jgi:hypothetical protein
MTGPYHHLTLVGVTNPLHQLGKADVAALVDKNKDHGVEQASLFKKRLIEVLSYDPISAQAPGTFGAAYLPAVLDITETPQAKFSQADRDVAAPIYGAAVCGFIAAFQSDARFKDQPVILFTKPFIFRDYQLAKAPCDLGKLKVWVSYHGQTGDRPLTDSDPVRRKAAEELCVPDGENRCVFEQYTSYGGFAVFATGAGLDLDRYIGTLDGMQSLLQRARPEASK